MEVENKKWSIAVRLRKAADSVQLVMNEVGPFRDLRKFSGPEVIEIPIIPELDKAFVVSSLCDFGNMIPDRASCSMRAIMKMLFRRCNGPFFEGHCRYGGRASSGPRFTNGRRPCLLKEYWKYFRADTLIGKAEAPAQQRSVHHREDSLRDSSATPHHQPLDHLH